MITLEKIHQRSQNLFSSIRFRVLLIAIVPLLLCGIILTTLTIYLRTTDSEINLDNFAQTTLDNVARSSEFALFSGNITMLRRISAIPLTNEFVKGVAFYDADNNLLLINGDITPPKQPLIHHSAQIIQHNTVSFYIKPVLVNNDDLMDQANESSSQSKKIGTVVIAITRIPLNKQYINILLTSFFALLGTFSLSWVLANHLGKSISQPIYAIADSVSDMQPHKLHTRVPEIGTQETQLLAAALNRLADDVEQSNAQLQFRIEKATAELQKTTQDLSKRNGELEAIRQDLELALVAKDDFLARMSHELRTPLTSILGFNRLLTATVLNLQQKQYADNIHHASTLLLSIIEDILHFTKSESTAPVISPSAFNLEELSTDLIELHSYNILNKNIDIVLLIDTDVPLVVIGDSSRLKQVINNLLANAIKFSDAGEIVFRISVVNQADGITTLQFLIKDSGIGIDSAHLPHLFQPFFQAEPTISRRYGGTGLGLSICQQLIKLMGGDITVESQLGKGTDVYFSLPFTTVESSCLSTHDTDTDNLSTLIISPLPWSRRALRNLLASDSNATYTAASVTQALSLLNSSKSFNCLIFALPYNQFDRNELIADLTSIKHYYSGNIFLLINPVHIQNDLTLHLHKHYAPIYFISKPISRSRIRDAISLNNTATHQTPSLAESASESFGNALQNMHILIAEDNPFNQQLLRSLIQLHGGTCQLAQNGKEVLSLHKAFQFDAMIIDMHMPDMNGIDTINAIRRDLKDPILIIGLTADLNSRNLQCMYDAGANVVLGKPIDEWALIKHLSALPDAASPPTQSIFQAGNAISKASLINELTRLYDCLHRACCDNNTTVCRDTLHQLLGLAGLFGMSDVKASIDMLQGIVHAGHTLEPHHITHLGNLITAHQTHQAQ